MRTALAFAWLIAGCSPLSPDESMVDLVVTGGQIVDVETGELHGGQAIVINGDRIDAIVASEDAPESKHVFDAEGRFIIPGLWDMHAHALYGQWPVIGEGATYTWGPYMDFMLAHGVTGFRDMWGTLDAIGKARSELDSGRRIGPRFIAAGHSIGWFKYMPGLKKAETEDEARALIRQAKADGADFIKLGPYNPAYLLPAFIDEARRLSTDVVGHVPPDMGAVEAAEMGVRSIEHSFGVIPGCAIGGVAVIDMAHEEFDINGEFSLPFVLQNHPLLADFDEEACARQARSLAEYDVWVGPTVALWEAKADAPTLDIEADPRFALVNNVDRDIWMGSLDYWRGVIEDTGDLTRRQYELRLKLIKALHDNGVPILAGSDFMNLAATPGMGLIDELRNYQKAGLSPLDALRTATLEPARYMRRTDELGTISAGKIADLVVLDENPLESIENVATTRAVIAGGVLLDRKALDQLIDDAKDSIRNAP